MEKKILYLGCNKKGEETLEGEIVGNKLACDHSNFRSKIKNDSKCSCSEYGDFGIYIFSMLNGNISKYNYVCLDCCKEKNLFEKYKSMEEFSYSTDVGLGGADI